MITLELLLALICSVLVIAYNNLQISPLVVFGIIRSNALLFKRNWQLKKQGRAWEQIQTVLKINQIKVNGFPHKREPQN